MVRLGRVNWDTRLGPSDGGRNGSTGRGVSFAPTFEENGQWIRLASIPDRYQGRFTVQFAHPLLVRCAVEYVPRRGAAGPRFSHEFVLTPDGVLCTLTRTGGTEPWGVTLPLLENERRPLNVSLANHPVIASTRYPGQSDEQNFLVMGEDVNLASEPTVRSTYGDIRPSGLRPAGPRSASSSYSRDREDASAKRVHDSLRVTESGFTSLLGTFDGSLYVGRSAAGGFGDHISMRRDGQPDASLSEPCGFILQLRSGKITAVETDRDVHATIQRASSTCVLICPLSSTDFTSHPYRYNFWASTYRSTARGVR